ncbi:MAG: hypothetical protein ABIZ52_06995, partial [Candidatus Limnocylindrales bacterium]
MFRRNLIGTTAALALIAAACGSGASPAPTGGGPTSAPATGNAATAAPATEAPPAAIGPGEGALNLVIWDGYAERG